jgi:hypothetical protein
MDLPPLRVRPWTGLGLVIDGIDGDDVPPDYVNDVLLAPAHRDAFFALVDRAGLVVCANVGGDDALHREVRGRSSRGRLSQGEYFHHDGCAGPIKPRIVEIRCPYQDIERYTPTAIAPFPEVVVAMLRELPRVLCTGELAAWCDAVGDDRPLPALDWDAVQGTVNRAVRRALPVEGQRAYLRGVDLRVGAYREPWQMGESRFMANSNPGRTIQHRRAYLEAHTGKRPNGRLLKRWPAEAADALDAEACAV